MKKNLLSLLCCFFFLSSVFAQVTVTEGPELNNDVKNTMNRIIDGEEGFYYAYRIQTKGKGTSFHIEKFSKSTMKLVFTKEVDIPTDRTKVEDVIFAGNNIYLVYRTYDKEQELMTLFYKTVSSTGTVSSEPGVIIARKTDHYEFIDFDITSDAAKVKIAVKCTFKANKEDTYKTDFVLLDSKSNKIEWTKTVPKYLKRSNPWFQWSFRSTETTGFLGFILENNGDIYYAYNEKLKKDDKKDDRYVASVELLKADRKTPIVAKLELPDGYLVYDLKYSINKQNELIIAGFFKDIIERKGRDLVDVGAFSFIVNTNSGDVLSKSIKIFDAKILTALESNQKRARYMNYKVDYIIPDGDDFYLVGEQYTVTVAQKQQNAFSSIQNIVALASGANPFYVGKMFIYEYMDVIVAKINSKGEFSWISNSPLRNGTTLEDNPHVFKQYIAVNSPSGIYLFYNEHPKNVERIKKDDFEPKDLKTQRYIHGSNMVFSKITSDGKVIHDVAFANETYCFAPIQERNIAHIPPQDAEIFAPSSKDEIIIYLEDKGLGRFAKVKMK